MYNNVGSGSKIDDAFLLMQAAHFSSATTNLLFIFYEFHKGFWECAEEATGRWLFI